MRLLISVIAGLQLVAFASAEEPFQQYKAQFQNAFDQFSSYFPNPNQYNAEDAAAAKQGSKKLSVLTLENWKAVLSGPVIADTTKPVDWWVLVTGLNKTCYGRCEQVEVAFNKTAEKLSLLPNAPNMAIANCEYQPILCGSWGATAGSLWLIEMKPLPAEIDAYKKRLNLTSTTPEDLITLVKSRSKDSFTPVTGIWHPFNGALANYGLSVPVAYLTWLAGLLPQWTWMLVITMFSRRMMSRRLNPTGPQGTGPDGAAPRPAGRAQ